MTVSATSQHSISRQACRGSSLRDDRLARPVPDLPVFVIRAEDFARLDHMADAMPKPIARAWINRGTGQHLRRQSVAMLLRTLAGDRPLSESVRRLHGNAGLQLVFASINERNAFARAWTCARQS